MAGNADSGRRPGPRSLRDDTMCELIELAHDTRVLAEALAHEQRRIGRQQERLARAAAGLRRAQEAEDAARLWTGAERRAGAPA